MGTMRSDVQDSLLHQHVHYRRADTIAYRWLARWSVEISHWTKRECLDPGATYFAMKNTHHNRVAEMLEKGVRWPTVKRLSLDDPRIKQDVWEQRMSDSLARSANNRSKGIGGPRNAFNK